MWYYVVIEIECSRQYNQAGYIVTEACWSTLYKVPIEQFTHKEYALEMAMTGCLAWIENNKVDGSKYAVMKMYLV